MKIDLSKLRIRTVVEADTEDMTEHRLALLAEVQGERDEDFKNQLRTDLTSYFSKAIREERFVALVAELDEKPVAYGAMVINEVPGDFNQTAYLEAEILNMYTLPQVRRQGISSLILEQLLQKAAGLGIRKVSLHTPPGGESMYRKFGFSEPAYPYLERMIP